MGNPIFYDGIICDMKSKSLNLTFTLLILSALFVVQISGASAQEGDMLARINALRSSVGRGAYTLNGALSAAAQSQAQWMADTGEIVHTRPDGSSPRSRAMNAGYSSAMISENIYRGTNASGDAAWTFWINSPIHYNGLVSPNYTEVGIGSANGSTGRAYVLVFGNPGGWAGAPAGNTGGNSAAAARAEPARIYAIGIDERGYIMHLLATGDTLGDIALIYGYTWDDIPNMMRLNDLDDPRELLPGEVFFVPPKGGTYTPSPGGPTFTPTYTHTPIPATITPFVFVAASDTPDELALMALSEIPSEATLQSLAGGTPMIPTPALSPQVTEISQALEPTATAVAMLLEVIEPQAPNTADVSNSGAPRNNSNTWILVAVVVQVGIIVMAGVEFARRSLKRRSETAMGQAMNRAQKGDHVLGQTVRRKQR